MIDLSKGLPNTITVDGEPYLIKTDFREWLKFTKIIEEGDCTLADILFVFENEYPMTDFSKEILEFYLNPNNVPNYRGGSEERVLDYLEDSEYIYASFMAVYGIDLCDVELHWWKFKALLLGLPDDSKIKQIMAMRSYVKSNKNDPDKIAMENKRAWGLPTSTKDKIDEEEIERELQELFYNC